MKELLLLDKQYNNVSFEIGDLIKFIDLFIDSEVNNKPTKNNIVCYYGDPLLTVQCLLQGLQNCQIINIVIQNMCLGINKFLVEIFKEILNDYMHIYLDDEKNYVLKKLYSEKKKISKILGFQYNEAELKQILLSQSSSADNYNNYMSSVVGTNSNIHNNDSCCSIF